MTMIQYLYLGRVGYDEGLRLQAEMAELRLQGRVENVLLLLEHPPVLTLGRNADRANILASEEVLARRGVTVHEINRGGDVTYHGPGQLVGYPIFDLRSLRNPQRRAHGAGGLCARDGRGADPAVRRLWSAGGKDCRADRGLVPWSCRRQPFGAERWRKEPQRKIGAIGIHVARGITSHGFAFNVTTDLRDFALIVPCGIPDHAVTSLERELEKPGEFDRPGSGGARGGEAVWAGIRSAGAGGGEPGGAAGSG